MLKEQVPVLIKHPLRVLTRWYWDLKGLPAQSLSDVSVFKNVLLTTEGDRLRVLEWGAGKSTVYYPRFLKSKGRQFDWHAIDNSNVWLEKCLTMLDRARMGGMVNLHCFDFPPFWDQPGYSTNNPCSAQSYQDEPNVINYINVPKSLGGAFNIVIIDGRFRRRCLLVAKEILSPKGIVILHDAHRAHYHSSLSAFHRVEFLRTGLVPGTTQESTIALCGISDDSPIDRVVAKFQTLRLAA